MTTPSPQPSPPGPPAGWAGPYAPPPGAMPAPAPASPPAWRPGALLVSLALVVLLAIGTGTGWAVYQAVVSDGESTGGLRVAWTAPYPDDKGDFDDFNTLGAWLLGDTVARAQGDGVIGYRLADGGRAWGVPAPEGTSLCAATQFLSDGRGAVAFGTKGTCDTVAGLDARSGKLTWRVKVPAEKSDRPSMIIAPRLFASKGVVVVHTAGRVLAYGVSDGRQKWQRTAGDCSFNDVRATETVVAIVVGCALGGGRILTLDPASGKTRVDKALPKSQQAPGYLLSAKPMITGPGIGVEEYLVFDDRGTVTGRFAEKIDGAELATTSINETLSVRGLEIRPYALHAGTVYLPARVESGAGPSKERVAAVDLGTGKLRWVSSDDGDGRPAIIRADDTGLLLWHPNRRSSRPQLVRLAADTGKATVVAEGPRSVAAEGDTSQVFERDGMLVIVAWRSAGADSSITVLRP
ncbi:outer membrane protein assembly factor BamB family protein [Couchioplanes caeruleus]|uniref:Pyrrolo-quinoline quinone repeat domain-containing protein n=2 Tax=Couchioplanes caeruleus TaxID=56438 RepID=A0A1K0FJC9_9ACTN|nr:PQQ-binding-like beta-propeller repeat protein [Couchioplanes caeruleus]OJF12949.1 hypothetical protein BG844_17935 [Couchioplanes caeruleus subsp. caeruleus]ROP28885.1 outer membrane protein assembly factor BamB [Couchioplanes caeruleus]